MKIGIFLEHLFEACKQSGRPLDDIVREAVEAGIQFVHINGSFWMENEKYVDELLERNGLYAESADASFDFTQGRDLDKAIEMLRFLSHKGMKQLLLIPGFVQEAQSRQSAMEAAAIRIQELMCVSRELHIQCSLEDFDNAAAPYGTWRELKWYTERIPELKITFDTGNFAFFGQDAAEAYRELKPFICLVHAKDRKFAGRSGEQSLTALDGQQLFPSDVGGGRMPVFEILDDLHRSGYQGGVLIEHFGSADMLSDLRRSAAYLKQWSS